jgi:hypothetical protein
MEINNHVAQLSSLAETLNQETDTYTESLTQLEKKLRQMNLGVEAWVPLKENNRSGNPKRQSTMMTMLGYAKTSDGWGFALRDVRVECGFYQGDADCPWEDHYDEGEPKLLLKSSRELRILAARYIGDLLVALQAAGNESVKALQEAKKLAQQI